MKRVSVKRVYQRRGNRLLPRPAHRGHGELWDPSARRVRRDRDVPRGLSWFGYSTIAGSHKFDISDFLIIAVIAAVIVSMGWALRYILAGTR
jgi:hypothetical protein